MAAKLEADSALLTVDGPQGEPRIYATSGPPVGAPLLDGITGEGPIGDALARGKPIAKRLRAPAAEADTPAHLGGHVGDVVIAPVRAPGGPTGALGFGWIELARGAREHALQTAVSYAALVGLWLEDRPSLIELLRTVYQDGLTGCLTFAALLAELEQEVRRCERTRQQLSCLFIDLDRLKQVNESEGHLMGNRVIAAAGQSMLSRVRSTDIVARYGGDEFVVVLPDTGALGASMLADSLRVGIAEATSRVLGRPVEASIGSAEWAAGTTASELLTWADRALDDAKRRRGVVR